MCVYPTCWSLEQDQQHMSIIAGDSFKQNMRKDFILILNLLSYHRVTVCFAETLCSASLTRLRTRAYGLF